jgi:hypothetical protein
VTHLIIDLIKSYCSDNILFFLLDQLLHVGVLVGLLFWGDKDVASLSNDVAQFWMYAVALVLVTSPVGFLIGLFLKAITKDERENKDETGMGTSAWIGILERVLIVVFIVTGQLEAIGFLVAAKSIFRFGETQKEGNKIAEYFLLGTLASFALAIFVGFGLRRLLGI